MTRSKNSPVAWLTGLLGPAMSCVLALLHKPGGLWLPLVIM
jgi:hypothetical protein